VNKKTDINTCTTEKKSIVLVVNVVVGKGLVLFRATTTDRFSDSIAARRKDRPSSKKKDTAMFLLFQLEVLSNEISRAKAALLGPV